MPVHTGATCQIRLNDCARRLSANLLPGRGGDMASSQINLGFLVDTASTDLGPLERVTADDVEGRRFQ